AARSLARTIFLGSVPGKAVAGIEENRVLLGAARPGESVSVYNDALGRLRARLQFLHGSEGRYWFGVHPNLNKTVTDRMGRISEDDVFAFLETRLREDRDPGDFAAMSVAPVEADVPDDTATRLVVISPRYTHKGGAEDSPAITWAKGLAATRGTSPRLNRNMLVFAAFDEEQLSTTVEQARTYLAWDSIVRDQTHLNLDEGQTKQASESKASASRSVDALLGEGYKWAIYPEQATRSVDGRWTVEGAETWAAQDASRTLGATGGLGRKISSALEHEERLLPAWSPLSLARELERWFWREGVNHVLVKKLWEENLCRYVYFPRLRNLEVLAKAITDGATSRDFFGYAAGFVDGRYVGLSFGQRPGSVLFDGEALIVRREAAEAAQPAAPSPERKEREGEPGPQGEEKPAGPASKTNYGCHRAPGRSARKSCGTSRGWWGRRSKCASKFERQFAKAFRIRW
ncbi:MAG TPA: hypothetical protein PJ994_07825, partial [Tepidiformaceae bacterium]|nr:hypothetical protein [Tepidiformaceae bacterium]